MAEQNKKEEKKKGSIVGALLIVILTLILVPSIILGGMYFFNKDFQMTFNSVMVNAPGGVGEYFASFPTRAEQEQQVFDIAEYMVSINEDRAMDKLKVMKQQDKAVYDEIIRTMIRINPNKTKTVLEMIRQSELSSDILLATLDGITSEKNEEIQADANYFASLLLPTAIEELKDRINASVNGHKEVSLIVEQLETELAARLLNQLDAEDRTLIMDLLSTDKSKAINTYNANQASKLSELMNNAQIYKTEAPSKLLGIIGDTNTYNTYDLSILYRELGPKLSGQVLAQVTDETFIYGLISQMKENEIIVNGEDNFTEDVLKSLKIYKEFDDNVRELTNIYENMGSDKVAEMVKRLIRNSSEPSVYNLSNGDVIIVSDEMLALKVLDNFSDKKVSEILGNLDDSLASDISRKMAMPSIN